MTAPDVLAQPATRRDLLTLLATLADVSGSPALRELYGLAWERLTLEWRQAPRWQTLATPSDVATVREVIDLRDEARS